MLDLDHPMTPHIFAASGLIDAIIERARRMTVCPSIMRVDLYQQCQLCVEELRQLNHQHFQSKPAIDAALTDLSLGLGIIAGLGNVSIVEDHSDGEGNCPACLTPIDKFDVTCGHGPNPSWIIMCRKCIEPIIESFYHLGRSRGGFGTNAI